MNVAGAEVPECALSKAAFCQVDDLLRNSRRLSRAEADLPSVTALGQVEDCLARSAPARPAACAQVRNKVQNLWSSGKPHCHSPSIAGGEWSHVFGYLLQIATGFSLIQVGPWSTLKAQKTAVQHRKSMDTGTYAGSVTRIRR